ncbi:putative phycocyanin operon protein Z [Prochlorococcus marinus str. MIT 1342]|uniref:HEAT repeat domain-containing protein n=2 Tax=Prochlorococcus TaxID=1218 RepID=UPI0007B35745|nr:hypothetical protein [Prochlorococcus marinus]KZR80647.1 putative phycocyanin operon protein Z [Prochlorococcus marinus str. MIT 1342]
MSKDENCKPDLEDLFDDFAHPNPQIKEEAYLKMSRHWPEESMPRLLANLDQTDIELRRASVKALGVFGGRSLLPLAQIFHANETRIVRTSCLKAFVQVAAKFPGEAFPKEAMEVVELALQDDIPELTLTVVPLLSLLGKQGLPLLLQSCKSKNILLAAIAVTALGEVDDPAAEACLKELQADDLIDDLLAGSVIDALNTLEQRNAGKPSTQ